MVSHGLRADSDLVFYAKEAYLVVHFVTPRLRGVRPDEASILGVLARAFRAAESVSNAPRSVYSGVLVCKRDLAAYLTQFPSKYLCSTRGLDVRHASLCSQPVLFIVPVSPRLEIEGTMHLKCPLDLMWPDQIISLLNLYLDRLWARGCK